MSAIKTSAIRHMLTAILLSALFIALPAKTETTGNSGELSATLTITMKGFRNTKGRVFIALFDKQNGFPNDRDKSCRKAKEDIDADSVVVVFENVPYGSYAISVYHDENNNGKLDKRWGVIPSEGIGSSNNVRQQKKAPSFDDARFSVTDSTVALEIKITYIFDD